MRTPTHRQLTHLHPRQLRRTLTRAALGLLPRLLAAGERVAPGPTSHLAYWMWCQLPPRLGPERRARTGAPNPTVVRAQVTGGLVTAHRFGPQGAPLAWLVHGWGGWRQQLEPLVEVLLQAGYQVISHDALSHGDSSPGREGARRSSAPEMGRTLGELARQWGSPDLVVAHSLGAQAATWAHTHHDLTYRRLVLLAPSVTVDDMVDRFVTHVPMGPRVRAAMLQRMAEAAGHDPSEFDLRLRAAERPADVPLLVVHDQDDPETPLASSRHLVEAWPGADLVTTRKLGHTRLLRSPQVSAVLAEWLARHPLSA